MLASVRTDCAGKGFDPRVSLCCVYVGQLKIPTKKAGKELRLYSAELSASMIHQACQIESSGGCPEIRLLSETDAVVCRSLRTLQSMDGVDGR
jgi:hypothetical protein